MLVFPEECQLCRAPLKSIAPYPVCSDCIALPTPLVAEIHCAQCGASFLDERSLNESGLCRLCAAGGTAFRTAFCFGEYEGALRDLIHLLKYRRMRPLARPLGNMMARALPPQAALDAIVPMPLHWWRRFRRGFNQAELLGEVLSARTGLPLLNALGRRRHTRTQAGLASVSQRRANVRGVFLVPLPERVRGKRLLLVDDVMTSGATVNSAAAALMAAGAARVDVLTLARADRRRAVIEFRSTVDSLADGGPA